MSSASPAQEFATQFLPLLLFSTMALSLTEVRSRYIVRKDATHGRDYVYDVDGDWTDDVFAVAFYEAVVWNYMALALAGPEATLQELKRDRYVPSGVLSLDEIRRVYTLKLKASDLRPYVISRKDQSDWSDDRIAVTIFEAIEASVPKKEAQEPCKHHSECMHNGMPWETNGMVGYQLTRLGTNWWTPTAPMVDGWWQKLFCNTKPSPNFCPYEFFEEAILASVNDVEWAYMHTHNARTMGILARCKHCGKIMRIGWNASSTLRHMQEQRAIVCSFLRIPFEMPDPDDSEEDVMYV